MTSTQMTKTRNALKIAAENLPLEEIHIRQMGNRLTNDAEAVAVAYRLSIELENVTIVLLDGGGQEIARYVNGTTLALPRATEMPPVSTGFRNLPGLGGAEG